MASGSILGTNGSSADSLDVRVKSSKLSPRPLRTPIAGARLPDFLGIGPPRTASTWLHEVLSGHVGLPDGIKESNFFRWHYSKGLDWYKNLFRASPPGLPAGEICPTYFVSPESSRRIARDMPNCRIICTLREPVARLYSHYRMLRRWGLAGADFEKALAEREELLDTCRYVTHLRRWFDTFGRDNVLVLLYEDLAPDPQEFLKSVCDFIEIEEFPLGDTPTRDDVINAVNRAPRSRRLARAGGLLFSWLKTNRYNSAIALWEKSPLWNLCFYGGPIYPRLDEKLRARLRLSFRPEIDLLEALIKRDLSAWK